MAGLLLLGDLFRDRNENVDGKQTNTVLVVARQVLEKGNYFFDHGFAVHFLDELGQVVRRLSAHHRGFIVYQSSKVLTEGLLQSRRRLLVWCGVEASRGDLGSEPVCFGQAEDERDEMLFDLVLGELLANLVEGLDGLCINSGQ